MHKSRGLCLHADPNRGGLLPHPEEMSRMEEVYTVSGVREKGMGKALMIIIEAPSGKPGESEQLPLFASPRATPHRDLALGSREGNFRK